MLGWQILKEGEYTIDLPVVSKEEEELVLGVQERFVETTRSKTVKTREDSIAFIAELMLMVAKEKRIYIESEQKAYLTKIAQMHIYGFAFIDELLENNEVEEISIIGPEKPAYIYLRKQGWKKVNAQFDSEKAIADCINKMARELGRHITMQNPRLDGMLPDGSRLHGSLPPLSKGEITIRRFRDRPFSPKELVESATTDLETVVLLSFLMHSDSSLIIAGNTASGKTTTVNALFSFVPKDERIILTEETPEINIPHEHQLRLVANREMGITLSDLVYDSLRMRPDRMVVGEVRNRQEAEALFDVLLAGQARGSYGTMHAQSSNEAVARLRSFGVNEQDVRSVDAIVVQRRMLAYDRNARKNKEIRKIVEISDLKGMDGSKSRLMANASEKLGMSKKEMQEEWKERTKIIRNADRNHKEFFVECQKKFYGL
ncbi:CpaF family protein [Candidatus Micrarchaeota archaeon]|nr:CpaF family protein [Candidatus Micrarchaeota archaeon]